MQLSEYHAVTHVDITDVISDVIATAAKVLPFIFGLIMKTTLFLNDYPRTRVKTFNH